MQTRKMLFGIFFLIVSIILITACASSQPQEITRFTPPKADVRMREFLKLDSVSYRVNDVYTLEKLEVGAGELGPSEIELQDKSMRFCQVEISMINHTDESLSIEVESVQFIGSNGQDYEPLGKLSDNHLPPNATRDFTLTFVVKQGMEVGGVVVVRDLSSDASGVIALRR